MENNNISLKNGNKKKPNSIEKEKEINTNNDLIYLINELNNFELNLKSINDINDILTKENLKFFQNLSLKENIRINLLINKIYMNIISKDNLYDEYLLSIDEKDIEKVQILLQFIDNSISIIEKLANFIFSSEIFEFKKKIIELIKCLYYNCKGKIKNEEILKKLLSLIETLPSKFFFSSFLEINRSKEIFEIFNSKETDKIYSFEEKFSQINNYFEQFEIFKKLMEANSNFVNYNSINEDSLSKIDKNEKYEINDKEIQFLINYGVFILKFCKYHNYIFLKEEISNQEKENIYNDRGEEDEGIRIVFLFDKVEQNEKEKFEDKEKKIGNLLNNKKFVSSLDSKVYKELIIKEIKFYLKLTQNIEKVQRIKIVKEHLAYYLSILIDESYYPLYLKDLTKISINDYFTTSFVTNVGAGSVNKLYFETPENEDTLVVIEFSLEDKSKDINFELNKYEIKFNKFISIFKDEKIQNTFKFLVYSHGYSLYEVVFDNYYSWFNGKEINYKISLLKLRKEDENQYNYMINGTNYYLNINGDKAKNSKENIINIHVILDMNIMNLVSFKEKENNEDGEKNEDELIFEEHKEEDEKIIPKYLFDYLIINYLKLHNIKENTKKRIIIWIFSQNRNLVSVSEDIKGINKNTRNNQKKNYIKSIGFLPENKLNGYNLEYKLFTRNEQILLYHMFLSFTKKIKLSKSLLIIEFYNSIANAALYNKGEILNNLEENNINFNNINIDCIDQILYLIKYTNNKFEKLEIILSSKNNTKENNKKLNDTFEKIKKYCQGIINPSLKIYEYEFDNICKNAIKYINLLYSD